MLYRRRWSSPHFTVALLAAGRRRVVRTCLPYPPDHLYSGSPRTFRLFLLASPPAHCLTLEGCPRHGSVAALGMDPSQPSAGIRRSPRHGSVAALGMLGRAVASFMEFGIAALDIAQVGWFAPAHGRAGASAPRARPGRSAMSSLASCAWCARARLFLATSPLSSLSMGTSRRSPTGGRSRYFALNSASAMAILHVA